LTSLEEFSPQSRISQYSDGKVADCGVLPQPQEWQFYSCQDGVTIGFIRMPGRRHVFLANEPDHKPYHGRGHEGYFEDSLAAPFDLSQDQGMTAGDQAGASACDANPIVSDKPCEKPGAFGRRDQGESQAAFASPGWPENEHASFADHDGTCMKIGSFQIGGREIRLRGQGLLRLWQKYQEAGTKDRDHAIGAGWPNPV
jgi:hypothetical protein